MSIFLYPFLIKNITPKLVETKGSFKNLCLVFCTHAFVFYNKAYGMFLNAFMSEDTTSTPVALTPKALALTILAIAKMNV